MMSGVSIPGERGGGEVTKASAEAVQIGSNGDDVWSIHTQRIEEIADYLIMQLKSILRDRFVEVVFFWTHTVHLVEWIQVLNKEGGGVNHTKFISALNCKYSAGN